MGLNKSAKLANTTTIYILREYIALLFFTTHIAPTVMLGLTIASSLMLYPA